MADLIRIIERIEKEGASLRILAMGLNTTTPTGKLMLNVLGSVAQFELKVRVPKPAELSKPARRIEVKVI